MASSPPLHRDSRLDHAHPAGVGVGARLVGGEGDDRIARRKVGLDAEGRYGKRGVAADELALGHVERELGGHAGLEADILIRPVVDFDRGALDSVGTRCGNDLVGAVLRRQGDVDSQQGRTIARSYQAKHDKHRPADAHEATPPPCFECRDDAASDKHKGHRAQAEGKERECAHRYASRCHRVDLHGRKGAAGHKTVY